MTAEEFITKVRQVVYDPAISGTLSVIQRPPGRRPSENLTALSAWYAQLSENDRKMLQSAVALAARGATFGMLAVLDGVRQIEETPEKGTLELWYAKGDRRVLLNSSRSEHLHDLFNRELERSAG